MKILHKMNDMLNESTSTNIFNPFLNLTSQLLRTNSVMIPPVTAIQALKTLGEFTQRIGYFLKQENTSLITNGTNEIAVGVSIQKNKGIFISVISTDTKQMQVHINHSRQHDENMICSVFIPGLVFEHPEGNVLQSMAYREPELFISTSSTVVSPVVSIAIGSKSIETVTPLRENITLFFKKNTKKPVSCAYWKFSETKESNGH